MRWCCVLKQRYESRRLFQWLCGGALARILCVAYLFLDVSLSLARRRGRSRCSSTGRLTAVSTTGLVAGTARFAAAGCCETVAVCCACNPPAQSLVSRSAWLASRKKDNTITALVSLVISARGRQTRGKGGRSGKRPPLMAGMSLRNTLR